MIQKKGKIYKMNCGPVILGGDSNLQSNKNTSLPLLTIKILYHTNRLTNNQS